MAGLRAVTRIGCAVAVLAAMALYLPAAAGAKFSSEGGTSEAPAGITVTGLGFAPKNPDAVSRAVGDARARAGTIARALRLQLGAAERIELPQLTQFGEPVSCRGRAKRAPGCRPPRQAAAAARVTFAIVGGSSGEGATRTVEAHGAAAAPVEPRNRGLSRSIKRAVLAARRDATPAAAAIAWRNARIAADAADIPLGPIVSVAETIPSYYGSSFYDAALGSFGPGQFCGIVRRPVVRRDPETGETRVVRRVPHRRCFAPSSYSFHLDVRYEAG